MKNLQLCLELELCKNKKQKPWALFGAWDLKDKQNKSVELGNWSVHTTQKKQKKQKKYWTLNPKCLKAPKLKPEPNFYKHFDLVLIPLWN
jgi:hypothetical protein